MASFPSTTVTVLSRGARESLPDVLEAALRCVPSPTAVTLVWSGPQEALPAVRRGVTVQTIGTETFDHGATRQLVLDACRTDILAFLSDDAEPVRSDWLEAIARPFADPQVIAVYGRQLARPGSSVAERVFRHVRYPGESRTILENDLRGSGELTLPVSNANAAYRVAAIRALGGFPRTCTFGEDRLLAVAGLDAGWRVHYAADAAVWHSHRLTWREMLGRARHAGALSRFIDGERGVSGFQSLRRAAELGWRMVQAAWECDGPRGVAEVLGASVARGLGFALGRLRDR